MLTSRRIPLKEGFSYDDVLLKPKKTSVKSRSLIDTSVSLGGLELEVPVVSAAMDTVTETELAREISRLGGLGVIHRFMPVEEQVEQVAEIKKEGLQVGAAIGLFDDDRAEKLVEAGVDALVFDIAHCHHEKALEKIEKFSKLYPETVLIAGNVATKEGAKDLEEAGADVVKVGIGPGSACTTRKVAGAGVPQFTAVKDCSEAVGVPVIADGGIREPGDLAKALMAGATAGMIGGLFAGTDEAPGELIEEDGEKKKVFRGMASKEAAEKRAEREEREFSYEDRAAEGVDSTTPYRGSLEQVVSKLEAGLRSSISYCGADNLEAARENAEFIKISNSTQARNGAHMETL